MKRLTSTPRQDGFHMPAEFEHHKGCLMIWPWRPGSWQNDAARAREVFSQIALIVAASEELYMMVRKEDYDNAVIMLKPEDNKNIHIIICDNDDAWARDTGATFVVNGETRRGIDWQFNAWGGEYDGLYSNWDKDQLVADSICKVLGDDCYDAHHFVLEGGSIHTDGEGTLITTEECLLSPGRNPLLSREGIEEQLRQYLGIDKVIWLPEGIVNDETNGHVDNFCCFSAPGEVLLAWTDDVNDPQYDRSVKAFKILSETVDARGRKFKIHKLPIPDKPICITEADLLGYEFEEGEDEREVGERLAASYVNFYIANGSVLVPQFGDVNDSRALEIIGFCFPGREIVGIAARDILTGGGNIHCITQQIPG